MRKLLVFLALLTFGALAVTNTAFAHTSQAWANCSKVSWSATNYEIQQVNTIEVKVDGVVVYSDASFGTTDIGNYPWSQAVDHSWAVKVNAPGTQYDFNFSGTQVACQPPETTTTVTVPETTTTVTVPETTTTITVPETTTTVTVPETTTTTTQPPVVTTATTTTTVPPVTTVTTVPPVEPTTTVAPIIPVTGGSNSLTMALAALTLMGVGAFMVKLARR